MAFVSPIFSLHYALSHDSFLTMRTISIVHVRPLEVEVVRMMTSMTSSFVSPYTCLALDFPGHYYTLDSYLQLEHS
jgi:hypothetical protein